MVKVIFDIEATCDDYRINPNFTMETIQIGAVKLLDDKVVAEFNEYIRPEYVDSLSDYCTELTGITWDDLEDARPFEDVIVDFYAFIYKHDIISCGKFDKKKLVQEIEEKCDEAIHALASNTIKSRHYDLKQIYSRITGNKKEGMVGMADKLGVTLDGQHHNALSDAKNLANIFLELERIRGEALSQTFTLEKMNKIIEAVNKNHMDGHSVVEEDGVIKVAFKPDNITLKLIEFLDVVSDVLILDNIDRDFNYVGRQDISILRRYVDQL